MPQPVVFSSRQQNLSASSFVKKSAAMLWQTNIVFKNSMILRKPWLDRLPRKTNIYFPGSLKLRKKAAKSASVQPMCHKEAWWLQREA